MSKCKNCGIGFATYGQPNAEYCSNTCESGEPMMYKMEKYEAIILDHITINSSYDEIKDACFKCAFNHDMEKCIESQTYLGECAPNKTVDGHKTIFKKVDTKKHDNYKRITRF